MEEECSSDKIYPPFEYARGSSQKAVGNLIFMWFYSGFCYFL